MCAAPHRAELPHSEATTEQTDALLCVEGRPSRINDDGSADEDEEWRETDEPQRREDDVHESLASRERDVMRARDDCER